MPTPYSSELRPLPGTSVPQRQSASPAGPSGFNYNPTYSIEAGMSRREIKDLVSRQVDDDLETILDMIGAPP